MYLAQLLQFDTGAKTKRTPRENTAVPHRLGNKGWRRSI